MPSRFPRATIRHMVQGGDADETRIRLVGARFGGGRLPIDSLQELEQYQRILRLFVKAEWHAAHPGEESPEGLDGAVSLAIAHIDEGSADIFLVIEQQAIYAEYQNAASSKAGEAIRAAYVGGELPQLPLTDTDEIRDALVGLGVTLAEEQAMELYIDGPTKPPVSVDVDSRHEAVEKLLVANFFATEPASLPQPTKAGPAQEDVLVGHVTRIIADKQKFTIVNPRFGTVGAIYKNDPNVLEDIREFVNQETDAPIMRIAGMLQYKNGKPWRFKTVESVEAFGVEEKPWGASLIRLVELQSGWDGTEHSMPVSVASLDVAKAVLDAIEGTAVPLPGIFPTEEGGVLIEWSSPESVHSIEITPELEIELYSLPADARTGTHRITKNVKDAAEFARGVRP